MTDRVQKHLLATAVTLRVIGDGAVVIGAIHIANGNLAGSRYAFPLLAGVMLLCQIVAGTLFSWADDRYLRRITTLATAVAAAVIFGLHSYLAGTFFCTLLSLLCWLDLTDRLNAGSV